MSRMYKNCICYEQWSHGH